MELDLTETWKEFKERPFTLSDKQKIFITKLLNNLDIITDDQIRMYLSEIIRRPIERVEELTLNEVGRVIYILKNRQKPSKSDLERVKQIHSLDQINDLFSKQKGGYIQIEKYEDLTHGQVSFLLDKKKRFKGIYRDHPIKSTMDYEYGWQESPLCEHNKLYYLKFYDLLMLDYDEMTYEEVIAILEPLKEVYLFEIHQTFNGYHVFIISHLINHKDPIASNLMSALKCDHYYVLFCYNNGFKIRLSKKIDRDETFLARVVGRYGNQALLNSDCQNLLDILADYLKVGIK